MKNTKKLTSAALCLGMLFSLAIASTAAAETSKSKTASVTDLSTEGTETTISLLVPGEENLDPIDIVFVLDSSVSQDASENIRAMQAMLDSLVARTNLVAKIGIVSFSAAVSAMPGDLVTLDSTSIAGIKAYLDAITSSSGSNIHGAVMKAHDMLSRDVAVRPENKYMVLLTDGGGTYYAKPDGTPVRMGHYVDSTKTSARPDTQRTTADDTGKYTTSGVAGKFDITGYSAASVNDLIRYNRLANGIVPSNTDYLTKVGEAYGDFPFAASDNSILTGPALTTLLGASGDMQVFADNAEYVTQLEKSFYLVAQELLAMKTAGYNTLTVSWLYHNRADRTVHKLMADSFIDWIEAYIGPRYRYEVTDAAVANQIFENIASDILYLIDSGKVTDVIGSNFDLKPDSFVLHIGDELQDKAELSPNKFFFGKPDAITNEYPYVVTYEPNGANGESFVWEINVPIEKNAQAKLEYTLVLNRALEPGEYTVPANESAVLEYTDSQGTSAQEDFPVPMITYVVTGGSSGTDPKPEKPDPDPAPEIPLGGTDVAPPTGDKSAPVIAVGLLVCSVLVLGAARAKKKSS